MVSCLQLPDLNWFEFEILTQLMNEKKYGNQILTELNLKFGADSVSSGKLYPALQKLEKHGLIERSKSNIKSKVARGIEPVHFSLTKKGHKELKMTTMHAVTAFFEDAMTKLRMNVAARAIELVAQSGKPPFKTGISMPGSEKRLGADVMKMLTSIDELDPVLILIEGICGKCTLCYDGLPNLGGFQTVKATETDVPLKDGYLDVLICVMTYRPEIEWTTYINEALRTLKKSGLLILIEFGSFNSFILEDIMNNIHKMSGAMCDLIDIDEDVLQQELMDKVKDISSERMKEMILVYGKKV
jgi:DNA-binding PadR family transcriptional regulator